MMAQNNQNKKIAEACKSLSNFGFPEEKVKATLSRLVKLYNNEWKFIEEENYRQVIDMLMEENEEGVKVNLIAFYTNSIPIHNIFFTRIILQ